MMARRITTCLSSPTVAAEICLASGGVTNYTIIDPTEPSRDETAATKDLQQFLTQITGAQFTIGGAAKHRIYIGRKAPGKKIPLKAFERRVREEDGDVYIYGNGCSGNAFAVYDFLEKFFDCRWYTFFGDMYIPEKREALFPSLTLDVVPSFDSFCYFGNIYTQRTTFGGRTSAAVAAFMTYGWGRRAPQFHRLGSSYPPDGRRGTAPACQAGGSQTGVRPLKYFEAKAYSKTNPETYSLSQDGTGIEPISPAIPTTGNAQRA